MNGKCQHACIGGYRCCLNGAVDHRLHICQHDDCPCHSRQRYDPDTGDAPRPKPRRIWRVEPLPYARTAQAHWVIPGGRTGLEEE